MNIEIGEYLRTTEGNIYKANDINKKSEKVEVISKWLFGEKLYIPFVEIAKHSKNIIDLIEVGDFVNGHKVRAVYLKGSAHYIKLDFENEEGKRFYNEDVKSIVTKQQFSNMEYKL